MHTLRLIQIYGYFILTEKNGIIYGRHSAARVISVSFIGMTCQNKALSNRQKLKQKFNSIGIQHQNESLRVWP